jgi:hypothetical protein
VQGQHDDDAIEMDNRERGQGWMIARS